MTTRRLTALLVVAALGGTVLSLGIVSEAVRHGCRGSARSASRSLVALAPAQALAQDNAENMDFKPVPGDSVTGEVRHRARAALPAPEAPGAPAVPPAPPMAPFPGTTDRSGDVVRFGSDITIRAGETVVGDVVAMGGDVTVDGHVEGDVVAMGGDVLLGSDGRVDGQVVTIGGQLHEQPGSHVGGQRVTAGGLSHRWRGAPFMGLLGIVGSGLKAAWAIAGMIVMLLVAWGFTQLAPSRTQAAYEAFRREPLMCLGLGLLAWALFIPSIVALALVIAILCITIIGIPLALAVVLGYVLAIMLLAIWGFVVGATVLGERLSRQLGRSAASLTLMAVWGIVALTVVKVAGLLFGGLPMGGAPGGLLVFLASALSCILGTMGAGSLLRTQLRRDALGKWWPSQRASTAPPAGGEAAGSPPAAPPVPPTPPSAGFYPPPPTGADPPASPTPPPTPAS